MDMYLRIKFMYFKLKSLSLENQRKPKRPIDNHRKTSYSKKDRYDGLENEILRMELSQRALERKGLKPWKIQGIKSKVHR